MGQATIVKQPGGRYKARDRFGRYDAWYKRKSGDAVLRELIRLLRKQEMKFRVIEQEYHWKVLWV